MFRDVEPPDPFEDEQTWDVRRFADLILRRWLTVCVASVALFVPSLAVVLLLPSVYQAAATVAIAPPAEVFRIGEEVLPEHRPGRRTTLEPEAAVVSSDRILGMVVDQLPDLDPESSAVVRLARRASAELGFVPEEPTREAVRRARIDALRESLELEDLGGGTVLAISVASPEPEGAAAFANAIADAFIYYKAEERRDAARRAVAWLSERSHELRYQIAEREQALSGLVARSGVAPRPEGAAPGTRKNLGAELHAARLELMTVEQQLGHLSPLPAPTDRERQEREELRARHAAARRDLEDARTRFTRTHPEVERLERVVYDLGRQVAALSELPAVEEVAERRREREVLSARRLQLQSRVSVLRRALDEQGSPEDTKQKAQLEYERLEREVAIDRQLLEVLVRRMNETVLTTATEATSASILDVAVAPLEPVYPNRRKGSLLALALCLAGGLGAALLRELLDGRVYEPESAVDALGAPLLGMIPSVEEGARPERMATAAYDSAAAESFRNLRTSLLFTAKGAPLGALLVTSGVAGEGKTTVTSNLAASFAQSGRSVVLVDADLRRPRVDQVFGLSRDPGLADLLRGHARLGLSLRRPAGCDFDVVTAGTLPDNPAELLGSAYFDLILSKLKARYDVVLIDSPVLLAVSDPLLLASRVEGTLLVVKPGTLERAAYDRMRGLLRRAGAHVVGVVVNRIRQAERYGYPSYLRSPYIDASARREIPELPATNPASTPVVEPS